ncbi:NAD-dependent epimerase/dehydratase family protein [Ornithinicoccus hortensis]|uniref:Nucleoside-diphosphate-sugar epimerase n=1 Tax=Ornithinicoccus hortensis TaxID=82346 RepID=A0A542YVF8_9MICO|nr:NAD-dependent epimerase/dehydratase family protein [Ornithinicoccus hortensis]TQL52069.1 nucleoside-diphosphate-sugar epimerase [Ornithinicoccus hortensis]
MRVLVTGASGMLGRATADQLAARGDEVTVMQRRPSAGAHRQVLGDVADPAAVAQAVAGQHAVVHLAAKVDVVGPWAEYERTNVEGTGHLLRAARQAGVRRFVQVSSPSVAHAGRSLTGVGAGPADPEHARGNYARSKAAAELLALSADASGFAVTAVRPHLVWGPGDTQLVGRILQRAHEGRLPLLGRGTPLVDTTYISNAADALVAALDRIGDAHGQAFVVTNGEPRPIGELIADICRAGGAPVPRLRIPPRLAWGAGALVEGAMAVCAAVPALPTITEPPLTRFLAEQLSTAHWFDQRRTREVLAWTPRVSLDEGLGRLSATG